MSKKIIKEVGGTSHAYTQTDGKTFRIFAYETKEIEANLVSKEMDASCKYGDILILDKDLPKKADTSKKESE